MWIKPSARVWLISLFLTTMACAVPACAQEYPSKAIRIITSTVGGGSDFITRLTALGISGPLGQQAIVDYRGGGVIPAETVAKAPPDGYTFLVHNSSVWMTPFFQKVSYDAVRDLAPVTVLVRSPSVLVMHPSVPVKSVKELLALAKAKPGALNFTSSVNGSRSQIDVDLLKSMAGVDFVRIPYANSTTETTDLLSGQAQLSFRSPGSMKEYVKAGRLKALAVTSAQPSPLFPGLPALAATVPGFESISIYGMWAPAKTPDVAIKRVNQEIARLLSTADVKEKLLNTGVEAVGSSPEEFAALIKADMARLDKMAKEGRLIKP